MSKSRQEISGFYDKYATQQAEVGVNIRHRTIIKRLKGLGLNSQSNVLEIGCGIGTLTGLLAAKAGKVLAVDISPESIERAKQRLSKFSNLSLMVSDMSDFVSQQKFDLVVLPDVLEHIPVEQHAALFKTIASVLHDNGRVCINIPDPYYLDWVRVNRPELLQIIDQSLYADILVPTIYSSGLVLQKFERYALSMDSEDYEWLELVKRPARTTYKKKEYLTAAMDEVKARI
ncbi:MAG: methyltransferase domain-containing protein [Bacteroidia bacterium]|nr:methyltransferase domain-containing protein [Bacteroidia bacterium]